MNFIDWTTTQQKQTTSNPRTMKTKHERDRLTRMEAMLHELVLLKQIIVEARTFQIPENTYGDKHRS